MSLGTVQEEIKKYTDQEKYTRDLRDRMDEEFALYRGDKELYEIPTDEGDWETIITNRAMVEVNRVIEDLSYAARKLWIPVSDEDHRSRKILSATELTANGIIHLADKILQDCPFGSEIQSLLAKYWVLRGISTKRFVLREEDGKIVPDVAVWDTRNVQWIEGRKRLIWVGNVRYASELQVKDEYKGWNGKVDSVTGLVKLHDVWDCSEPEKPAQEGVIIDNEYVKEPEDVKVGDTKLDYLPINIAARRGMPLISDTHNDNIRFSAQGYLTNNRNLFTIESRLLSYIMTSASRDAKTPIIIEWDGTGISPAEKFQDKDPFVQGRVIVLNTSRGEKLAGNLPPSNTGHIAQMYEALQGLLGIGGMNPVAFGRINQALPAQGIDILSNAALANEKAFKAGIEGDFIWLAGEVIRQFKMGDFGEQEFEGYDKSNNPFHVKVKPKDINDNWHFACQLVPDLIRDKATNASVASQMVRDGLLSRQTARDQFQLVTDTDLEETKVAKERALALFGIGELEALLSYVDDFVKTKDPKTLFILKHAYDNLIMSMGKTQEPAGNGTMPVKSVVNLPTRRPMGNVPQEQIGNIPQPVVEAARREATGGTRTV